jgi:hypothetical protein
MKLPSPWHANAAVCILAFIKPVAVRQSYSESNVNARTDGSTAVSLGSETAYSVASEDVLDETAKIAATIRAEFLHRVHTEHAIAIKLRFAKENENHLISPCVGASAFTRPKLLLP